VRLKSTFKARCVVLSQQQQIRERICILACAVAHEIACCGFVSDERSLAFLF
jgi:hypothetical protein